MNNNKFVKFNTLLYEEILMLHINFLALEVTKIYRRSKSVTKSGYLIKIKSYNGSKKMATHLQINLFLI